MRIFNTACPHCGTKVNFTGDNFDSEMRCLNCGGTFALMSDAKSSLFGDPALDTRCPHCGNALKINQNDFGCKLCCPNCSGYFAFSRLQGEVKLYRTYAAVLWGILLGPFIGCWFFKKNFEEMGMMEEAEEYRPLLVRYVSKIVLIPLAMFAVDIVAILITMLTGSIDFLSDLGKIGSVLLIVLPWGVSIHTTASYAMKYCNGVDCLSYHVYKSTWPPTLIYLLIAPVLFIPLIVLVFGEILVLFLLLRLVFG